MNPDSLTDSEIKSNVFDIVATCMAGLLLVVVANLVLSEPPDGTVVIREGSAAPETSLRPKARPDTWVLETPSQKIGQ